MKVIIGGSSETALNVPTTMPTGRPSSSSDVISVTPVGYSPSTVRHHCDFGVPGSDEAVFG